MAEALDVASYFLATLGNDPENDLTQLKLQKLCAYAQGYCLALTGKPLFNENIEAWKHGPVIPSLYRQFKAYGRKPVYGVAIGRAEARKPFADDQLLALDIVEHGHGGMSAMQLRQKSHRDFPGIFGSRAIIDKRDITDAFGRDPFVKKLIDNPHDGGRDPQEGDTCSMDELWDALAV